VAALDQAGRLAEVAVFGVVVGDGDRARDRVRLAIGRLRRHEVPAHTVQLRQGQPVEDQLRPEVHPARVLLRQAPALADALFVGLAGSVPLAAQAEDRPSVVVDVGQLGAVGRHVGVGRH
jgi:hypothetical protein